ncbi:MAG: hypothetical protein QM690_07085 [Sphingobium sp.]
MVHFAYREISMTDGKQDEDKLHIPEPDRGHQERPMTEEEKLETSLEDSMDASDPSEIVQPHRHKED